MSIPATEPLTYTGMFGTTPAASTGATTSTSKSADKDMFLQLLVAQMKYQDPMNPTDSGEFLSQSAQFTALEKMQAVADQTAQLVASQMAFGASNLVGRTVSWTSEDGVAQSGSVSGVQFGTQGPMLEVGGTSITLGQVQSVTNGGAGTSGGSSTGSSTGSGTSPSA